MSSQLFPYTVEPHVYRQPGKYIVHLVNYDHTEKAPGKSVVEREAPRRSPPVKIQLPLPPKSTVRRVVFLDPDQDGERKLKFEHKDGVLYFSTPPFLVYGVCGIELR